MSKNNVFVPKPRDLGSSTLMSPLFYIFGEPVLFLPPWIDAHENIENEKSAQRDANTARALAVVRFGTARPSAVTNPQTGPITIHCAAAS